MGCWKAGRHTSRGQQSSWGLADPGSPGACPRKLLRLRKPDGRVWCVLESSYPGATPEGAVLLAAGGSRPDREVRQGRGLDRNPGQCRGYFQPPRPSDPRLPRREATLPPARRGHSPRVGGYSSSFGLNNQGSPWETSASGPLTVASPRQLSGSETLQTLAQCSLKTRLSHGRPFIEVLMSG